jgi:hypothetical protein
MARLGRVTALLVMVAGLVTLLAGTSVLLGGGLVAAGAYGLILPEFVDARGSPR